MGALLIGGLLGLLSGFFGLGGSSIGTPVLQELLGVAPLLALGTPLPVTIPGAAVAAATFSHGGFLDRRTGLWTLASALPASIAGSVLSAAVPIRGLMGLIGVLIAGVGVIFFVQPILRRHRPRAGRPAERRSQPFPRGRILIIGALGGLLAGLLANGGGILFVPAYILFLRISTKEALGTSFLVVVGVALPSSAIHAWLGHVDFALAGLLAIGMIPLTWVGAKLALAVPPARLRQVYGIALVIFAVDFIAQEVRAP